MNKTDILQFRTIDQASRYAADLIVDIVHSAVSRKGFCTIVMAGGRTPQQTYKLLGTPPASSRMDWEKTHFFWGDERWVPSGDPASNFSMAEKNLLSHIDIPPGNIHPMYSGHPDSETGAVMYEEHLRSFFAGMRDEPAGRTQNETGFPVFDLVLLGMGPDGHTASLFPGQSVLDEKLKWVAAVPAGVGSPPVERITLTLPLINQAENILFFISGNDKREILSTILDRPGEAAKLYPAARVSAQKNLVWLVAEKD